MLKGKSLLEYTNLFSPNEYKKNDKIILFLWIDFIKVKIKKSTVFICRVLNYICHSLIAISIITGYVPICAFASLVIIPVGIARSSIGLKTCVIASRIKKYKSIIKKNKKNDKIVLLIKSKLNYLEVLI